ncbi:MAG: TIGR03621 family F420-dependent LLM class oxidoreductase [Ktedonobacteraceae bacterium]|nr:TIGR03621 family F420-dependent LLM class oxidoreductase [Ktedonobacteraceae bacterium]
MAKAFRFGVVSGGLPSGAEWVSFAQRVEALGYSSLLLPDRTVTMLATIPALTAAAIATKTLRIGSYVFANDYRHPALLAREVATLDVLSNGRVECGLGAGVGESDFQQLDIPFESAGVRVSRFEEGLQIMKQFFTSEVVDFSGKYYKVAHMPALPRPVQQPHPPFIVGSAGRRMLTIAAREANIIAPTRRWRGRDFDPDDTPLEEKVAWIRKAAGSRFEQIELSQSAFGITLTDSPASTTPIKGGPPVIPQPMTTEQAIEHLVNQRERLGISYIQVQEGQIENFAPVVARLNGVS